VPRIINQKNCFSVDPVDFGFFHRRPDLNPVDVDTRDGEEILTQEGACSSIAATDLQDLSDAFALGKADEFRRQRYQIRKFPFSARNHVESETNPVS
jgi:hypothetical protein